VAGEIEVAKSLRVSEAAKLAAIEEQREVERSLFRAVMVRALVSIPVGVGIVVGLVALAVGSQHPDWGVWLGTAAGIGVLAGAFFGSLFGFIVKAHVLDELGPHARERAHE
jgi:hypothetical protein